MNSKPHLGSAAQHSPVSSRHKFAQILHVPHQYAAGTGVVASDAVAYILKVKAAFADRKEVFHAFVNMLKDFKARRLDTGGVISHVKDLFAGHIDLILGFNQFLPEGREIQMADIQIANKEHPGCMSNSGLLNSEQQALAFLLEAKAPPGHTDRTTTYPALLYLSDVKSRFADREEVYYTFLDLLKDYKAHRITTSGVVTHVKELFKGHRGLVLGLNAFLPKGCQIEPADVADMDDDEPSHAGPDEVDIDHAVDYIQRIKTRFARDDHVYRAFLEILNMYRKGRKTITHVYQQVTALFSNEPDLVTGFMQFVPPCHQGQLPLPHGQSITVTAPTSNTDGRCNCSRDGSSSSCSSSGQHDSCTVDRVSGAKADDSTCSLQKDRKYAQDMQDAMLLSCRGGHQLRARPPCRVCKQQRHGSACKRKTRTLRRIMVQADGAAEAAVGQQPSSRTLTPNEYEQQRAERIAHNQRMLQLLGINQAADELKMTFKGI